MSDTTLNRFLASGTAAAMAAYTPSPPTPASGPSFGYMFYQTDTGQLYSWNASGAAWVQITQGTATVANSIVDGRLTTETGVPVSTSDRTSQSTIYFTPYKGNRISLYTGAAWTVLTFTELSLALSGLTSGKNYDVFVDYNSGTPQLVLSAAWTNDTTRADAIALQNGVYVKSGTTTYRLVGTIRTTSTTTTEDSIGGSTTQVGGKRFVWNLYNQVRRQISVVDKTDNWSYATNTIRQANGASGNKVEYVCGMANELVTGYVLANVALLSSAQDGAAAIGVDSVTVYAGPIVGQIANFLSTGIHSFVYSPYEGYPGLGYHYLAWLESGAGGTTSWTGDNGVAGRMQSGLTAVIFN